MAALYTFIVVVVLFVAVNKLWCFWCRSKACLVGKTAIITGGASGLGFQSGLALAAKGCRIIIADIANLSQAVENMKELTRNPNIIGQEIDLQSFKSVRQFAKKILESEPRLDILMCNAGIPDVTSRKITQDGLEKTMQVNYFSHFLLTHLLLDLLKKSAPSRITFTSSLMAYVADLKIDKLIQDVDYHKQLLARFNGGTYSNSKLCMAGAAVMFGERLKGTGVTANAAVVGGVKTPIFKRALATDQNYLSGLLMSLVYLYGKTPEEGAQTLIHLAHSDDVQKVTGQLFIEGISFPRAPKLTDEFLAKLWKASLEYTKLESHEIAC